MIQTDLTYSGKYVCKDLHITRKVVFTMSFVIRVGFWAADDPIENFFFRKGSFIGLPTDPTYESPCLMLIGPDNIILCICNYVNLCAIALKIKKLKKLS